MEGVKCVLLDIEGTICPISFVKDTLFPYALKALPDVLNSRWDEEEFKPYREAFPDSAQTSPEALQAHVEDLTKRDVKVAYLKNLQGYLWESGYKTGAYSTPLFTDVAPTLKQWKEEGFSLAIYSSGSVFAQKLLFGHVKTPEIATGLKRPRPGEVEGENEDATEPPSKKRGAVAEDRPDQRPFTHVANLAAKAKAPEAEDASPDIATECGEELSTDEKDTVTEDLQYLISEWFDTSTAGPKMNASSYEHIASKLEVRTSNVLFLSDNVNEVDAAVAAGMCSFMVERPGNAPLSEDDRARLRVMCSLSEIDLVANASETGAKEQVSED
ncbi:enolase-phosphatase E1 [Vermiconidia calcicola]|uniref:Enolase-phosphatase E1 n=1 Tax=Vermiconidia calcicola TaxID=1690605 RepID=A0ACC3MUM9_9PEZI|nr:enolase-phosphatase E1 [Vermiconidia calcicola]